MSIPDKLVERLARLREVKLDDIVAAVNREIVPFLKEMRDQYNAHQHAGEAGCCGCCPKTCATVFTTGDVLTVVPEFTTTIPDEHYAYLTVRGTSVQTVSNVNSDGVSYIFARAIARRWDADSVNPGLFIMNGGADNSNSIFFAGSNVIVQASGSNLQVVLDSSAGDWRWQLEMELCLIPQRIDLIGGA